MKDSVENSVNDSKTSQRNFNKPKQLEDIDIEQS
jgi:hypothetical protein